MAAEILSLVDQLEKAIERVPKDEWERQNPNVRRKACDTIRKLSLDLEAWDDIVDRIIYSVRYFLDLMNRN